MSALHPNPSAAPEAVRTDATASDDCRCLCGSLLARLVDGGVELKCRRCKRTVLIPLDETSQSTEARGEPSRAQPAAPQRAPVRAEPRGREGQPCLGRSQRSRS